MLARLPFILLLLLWASSAASSQLGNGLLGYALYGGSSLPGEAKITSTAMSTDGLDVAFTPASDEGGYPISGYQYSVDGVLWFDIPAGQSMFTVPNSKLTSGTTVTVLIRTVSAGGVSQGNAQAQAQVPKEDLRPVPTSPIWLTMLMAALLALLVRFRRLL